MILAVDAGNTGISFGFYTDDTMLHLCKFSSSPIKGIDEYSILLLNFCVQNSIDKADVTGCVISSVVPPLTNRLKDVVEKIFKCNPLIISHGVKTGLNIRIDNHTQLGSDIVANTVAAACILPKPFAVIDLGTATTISAVNLSGELFGVMIMPGVRLSADALSASAAELPYISFEKPKALLGKNTNDSMLSGCIYGTAAMLDCVISRIKDVYNFNNLSVVASGGHADEIIPFCKTKIIIKNNLTLDGLIQLYHLNKRKPNAI